jgi:predicted  nucleic acid-binding Zn-ribbon protein
MTRKEKIEFLSRYKEIDDEINRFCEESSVWRARVTKITPTYSCLPKGSRQDDKLQSEIEKIMEMEEEINAEIDRLLDAKQAIIKSIRKKMALFDLIPYNYI